MKQTNPRNCLPVYEETLSAKAFLDLVHQSPHLIASSRIEMPRLGDKNWGGIRVKYTRPLYKGALPF